MGSVFGSAGGAAKAQEAAAQQSLALQKQMYDQTRTDNMPFLQTGTAANQRLATLLGLNPTIGQGESKFTDPVAQADYLSKLNDPGSVTYFGGQSGIKDWVAKRFNATWGQDQVDNTGAEGFGSLLDNYTGQDLYDDPSYQFRLDEGNKALERSQAAKGGLLSGAALKAAQTYGQNMASTEYGNAYNRFNNDQTNLYNRLAGISGTGQQAVNTAATAGQNYAQGATSAYNAIGNAQSAKQSGGWGTGLLNAVGQGAALYSAFSERDMKENIEPLGTENGHNIYKFSYKDDPESKRYIGVMVDEVEKTHPEAIIENDGRKMVNYSAINVNFREA